MRKLALAVLAAMSVGACATAGNGNGNGASTVPVVAGKAQYCWADRVEAIGTRFNCNWAATKEEACAGSGAFSTVDGTGYAYPRVTSTCASGQRLLELTPKA
jgi:hypothetical protein